MLLNRRYFFLTGTAALLSAATVASAEQVAGPAYQIVLRTRHASVTPARNNNSQTGGGSIIVEQPEPHTIVVTMGGAAVVASGHRGAIAGLDFNLEQDLEIIPTRAGVRPPRVGIVGRVVGTMQVTDPGKHGKACGCAEQGPGVAGLSIGDTNLLTINVEPSAASCGQELAINHREGPLEAVAGTGQYHLSASFRIGVAQGRGVFHRQYAVADFDPAPQLDAAWADALKPFRAVPRNDFGFKIAVRVVEDRPADVVPEDVTSR